MVNVPVMIYTTKLRKVGRQFVQKGGKHKETKLDFAIELGSKNLTRLLFFLNR